MRIDETLVRLRDDLKKWVTNNLHAVEDAVNNRVTVVTKLPAASAELRGQTLLLAGDTNDALYVCMKVNGAYQWVAK